MNGLSRLAPGRWPVSVRVTFYFALISGLWIFFSDQVLGLLVRDPELFTRISMLKGWFYVLIAAAFLFLYVQRNLSRLEAAHAELVRQREELLLTQFTIDKSNDMILWVDSTARILNANPSAARHLETSVETLKTLRLAQFDCDFDEATWLEFWNRLVRDSVLKLDRVFLSPSGRRFPVHLSADLIHFQGREFACAYIRDTTEERRVEQQSRQAQKMESVGTLAAGVAHDFNNILTGISGCAELLAKVVDDPERAKPLAAQIQAGVRRAAQLVQGLLTFSRAQKMQTEPIHLNGQLQGMQGLLARLLGDGISIQWKLDEGDPVVEVDPAPWEQVLLNLAVNARDAMDGRGLLVVSTRVLGERVELSVRDSGPGVAPGIRDRIFEPFFTTKQPGKGTGLGLSTAYGIVTQHQGTLRVVSPPEGGAEFVLSLPLRGGGSRPGS